MNLPKNELVPTRNGFKVRYQNREGKDSWLCVGTYWGPHECKAMVIRSKFVAGLVAVFWDVQRHRAATEMNR